MPESINPLSALRGSENKYLLSTLKIFFEIALGDLDSVYKVS